MNKLSTDARAAILAALCEGNSIRSVSRLTGRSQQTISRLLLEMGAACVRFHDARVRNLPTRRAEVDEVWSFVGCKEKQVPHAKRPESIGDVWVWTALDSESKLAISWFIGDRDAGAANAFMRDVAARLSHRIQLTSDGHNAYLEAVENAFGWNNIDFAVLQKIYGSPPSEDARRYSPAVCIGARKERVMGNPVKALVSTSYVERSNLSLRMRCRRFTRLTNAFSKKLEHHAAAVALSFVHYNWCRPHRTLTKANRGIYKTPAMAAGLTDRVWTPADLVGLLELQRLAA
jgi:IS1 family transposase